MNEAVESERRPIQTFKIPAKCFFTHFMKILNNSFEIKNLTSIVKVPKSSKLEKNPLSQISF